MTRDFQVFVKPIGATCNMGCRYCYYLKTGGPLGQRMPEDVLERYIAQHLEAAPRPEVTFSWHGGEPTALGLEYFRTIVELQRKYARAGQVVVNGVQTNGLLIDEAWCRFFAAEHFRVGLSLDGPAELHDVYRLTRAELPTHAHVVRAFELLKRFHVPCDLLCVVHDRNVRHPLTVYRFFRRIGASFITFLPLVQRSTEDATRAIPESVPALAYGDFLCAVFDEWLARDVGRIAVQAFEEAARPARGLDHSLCIYRKTCGDLPVVERNGDFYTCDHFVDAAHLVGNITERHLADLLDDPIQRQFGDAKRETLPRCCRECAVLAMCNGGCPKDRFARTPDGEAGLNYLCPGLKRFFTHVAPWAERLAREQPGRREFDQMLAAPVNAGTKAGQAAGRNALCPCGSGKKFKKCCGRP